MYTLGAGRIVIKSNIIVCLLNLMAWKASWAHRTGENEKKRKRDKIKIKKSVQTSSVCGWNNSGADPGFLDRGFKFRKGDSFS